MSGGARPPVRAVRPFLQFKPQKHPSEGCYCDSNCTSGAFKHIAMGANQTRRFGLILFTCGLHSDRSPQSTPSMPSFRVILSTLAAALPAAALAAAALAAVPPQPRAGQALPDLTWGQSQRFMDGRHAYITPLLPAQGLGPGFNRHSCVDCHETPIGGWSAIKVTHFGLESPGGYDFLEHLGGPVLQADAIDDACQEVVPAIANHVRQRVTPSVLAFGRTRAHWA